MEQRFGHYEIESLIGQGGMGEVYRAHDTRRDRIVALKVLPDAVSQDAEYQHRFRRESFAAARLREPHIVPIHDYGELDGRLYIDMRLVDGRSLTEVLAEAGALPAERAVGLIGQVADALDAAHADGLVHRDVKPSNVLVSANDFVYVVDFGLALSVGQNTSRLTMTGVTIGTLDYMAPERFENRPVDRRTDVYSLACMLFECLTGEKPFLGDDLPSQMYAHMYVDPRRPSASNPGVPSALDDVVARGMAKNPEDRFASAGELGAAARAALTTVGIPVPVAASVSSGDASWEPAATSGPAAPAAGVPVAAVPAPGAQAPGAQAPGAPAQHTSALRMSAQDGQPQGHPGPAQPGQAHPGPAQSYPAQSYPAQGSPAQGSPAQGHPGQGSTGHEVTQAIPLSGSAAPNRQAAGSGGTAAPPGDLTVPTPGGQPAAPVGLLENPAPPVPPPGAPASGGPGGGGRRRKGILIVVVALVAVLAVVGALLFAFGGLGGSGSGPGRSGGPLPGTGKLPVANSVATPSVGSTEPVGPTPGYMEIAPDGKFGYIANRGAGLITVFDTTRNAVTATIPVPDGGPQFVAFSPDGSKAYVSVFNTDYTVNEVVVVDTSSAEIVARVPTGKRPFALDVTPDGKKVYVPNHDSGSITVIDTDSNTVINTINVAPNPHWVDISPDGRWLYAANHESNLITTLDLSNDSVVRTTPVGKSPHSIVRHPKKPIVINANYDDSTVSVTDANTGAVLATIPTASHPQDLTLSADGKYAYIAAVDANAVQVLDTATYKITATVPVGKGPTSVAVGPDGRQAYVTNLLDGTVTVLNIAGTA